MSDKEPERFEDVVGALEALVTQLEAGQLPLDEALQIYERGVALARKGNTLLEGAEKRVEELQKDLSEVSQ